MYMHNLSNYAQNNITILYSIQYPLIQVLPGGLNDLAPFSQYMRNDSRLWLITK